MVVDQAGISPNPARDRVIVKLPRDASERSTRPRRRAYTLIGLAEGRLVRAIRSSINRSISWASFLCDSP
jgi:hypothetical protein